MIIIHPMNGFLLAIAIIASTGWLYTFFKQRRVARDFQRIENEIELIQHSIRSLGAGTFYYNIKQDASYWDERSKEMFGFPELSDPIPPGFWESRILEEDRERIIVGALNLLSDKASNLMSREYRTRLPSGEIRWIRGTQYLRRDHEGNIIETFGFHFDITSQNLYEQSLLRERQRAVSGMLAKSQFLANMSHEIRTPMSAILGIIELLDEQSLNSVQRSYLGTLKNSGQVLMRIVNDILDLSKMEAGKLKLESKPFNIREAVYQCLSIYTQESDSKNIFLAAYIDQKLPQTIQGDSIRLQQALMNLLGNAFKFTQDGSILLVIEVADNNKMRIEVRDTGAGIKPNHISKLFNRFEQGADDTSSRFGGSGLGLTIIKNIVELWHGEVGVQSTYGKGSTFWCELPFDEPLQSAELNRNSQVLVCSRFKELAQLWAIDPLAPKAQFANDADEFKSLFKSQRFDHVIVEQRVPNSQGPELLAWVKSQAPQTFTTLIGYEKYVGNDSDLPSVDRYCPKPYIIQDLWQQIPSSGATTKTVDLIETVENYQGLKVLIVDDVDTNVMVIKGLLKRFGIKADSCTDGYQCLEACESTHYDLILMDYEMPGLSGPETAVKLLKTNSVCIIGLSAHVGAEFVKACIDSGMKDYLAKPVTTENLSHLLAKYFHHSKNTLANEG